jgi:hypothetical protein
MAISGHNEARKTAELLETEITVGLECIRTRVEGVVGGDALLDRLDALDERRIELRRRLDGMPDVGGGAGLHGGMASDTPLAGLADVVLRVRRLEEVLADDPTPASVAATERVAAESLPRPVGLLSRQREVLDGLRRGDATPRSPSGGRDD